MMAKLLSVQRLKLLRVLQRAVLMKLIVQGLQSDDLLNSSAINKCFIVI